MKRLSILAAILLGVHTAQAASAADRPNVLFALADDWSWPHASAYGTAEVETPNFDRMAREGILLNNVFTAAPQCSPNRAATLTGRHIWQIEEAGTHASNFPNHYQVFTGLLDAAGYHVGFTGKGWSPGNWEAGGWPHNPAGREYNQLKHRDRPAKGINDNDYSGNFAAFMEDRPEGAPFFFWFGCKEPHRSYEKGSGIRAGKNPDNVKVPAYLPDTPEIRSDILDYYLEVEWFDTQLGRMIEQIKAAGEWDNTIVVVSADNGMPFPRAKANLYDDGVRVPMAIRWPGHVRAGQESDMLLSFVDLGPTFLAAAGLPAPEAMTGRNLMPRLGGAKIADRPYVLTGRERHTHARYDNWGYPARAIRTPEYLYIRNFKPDRWPAGQPEGYEDIDDCPTLTFMQENADKYPELWQASVGKRPAVELFHIPSDPGCLKNLATSENHAETRARLSAQLDNLLTKQGDPRMHGRGDIFESYPRYSGMRPHLGGFAEQGEYNPAYVPEEE
jgi:uncharacterized sulfatase